jgi:hypothetical protein
LAAVVPSCQRIAGWFILYDLFRSDVHGTNPFLPVFVDGMKKATSTAEKQFLVHLATAPAFAREVRYFCECTSF